MAGASIAALLAVAVAVGGHAAPRATPAWNGSAPADALTEVRVGQSSPAMTTLGVTAHWQQVSVSADASNDATIPIRIPVLPTHGNVDITIRDGGSDTVETVSFSAVNGGKQIVISGNGRTQQLADVDNTLPIPPAQLPALASAYQHIAAFVVDGAALASLDDGQLLAIVEHAGTCGRIMLVDAGAESQRYFTNSAGCSAQFLRTVSAGDDLHLELRALLAAPAPSLPDSRALQRLAERPTGDVGLMAGYLGAFLLIYALLALLPGTRAVAVGFSLLAVGMGLVLWPDRYESRTVAWAEVDGDDRIARYRALEALSAGGRAQLAVQPESLQRPLQHVSGDAITLWWDASASGRQIDWQPHLLAEMELVTSGSFAIESGLRAGVVDGHATVCNIGARPMPSAYVHWQHAVYPVPGLAPGERWTLAPDAESVTGTAALRLLQTQAAADDLTVMRPLRMPGNGSRNQQAWLLRTESVGGTACVG